ncbi:hypothetical protein Srubr_18620 [Streptomyces rubradiris]|uniref:Major facilitator superfamily (MFS) profile domain-containing protein n=1 Tax=Streptomyces rubradiris TaxID=285531 RepID=A0ABQ3R837_STRRR|nr:MFS transporter [Streptomyces rubradiris]GHI52016.1 hypothetical protein Srubr_18620 [Streptomyces rubradiris]
MGSGALAAAWLLAARVVQGAGAAMAGPNALALLHTVFTEPKARVRALALYSGMASVGFAVGLILGGVLAQWLGWRAVLFINVPLGVPAIVLAGRYLPVTPRREARLDLPGALTATGGVAALVFGFIRSATHGWGDVASGLALLAGAALIVVFLLPGAAGGAAAAAAGAVRRPQPRGRVHQCVRRLHGEHVDVLLPVPVSAGRARHGSAVDRFGVSFRRPS